MNYLLILFFLFNIDCYAKKLYILSSELPSSIDFSKTYDVFSLNLINQISEGLFKLDENGQPIPNLIDDFEVLDSGKTYILKISKIKQSDFSKIKNIIEQNIINNTPRSELFNDLIGIREFKEKKEKTIKGILIEKGQVKFQFNKKNFNLPYVLSDLRYSINFEYLNKTYKLEQLKKNKVIIKNENLIFSEIEYITNCSQLKIDDYFIALSPPQKECISKLTVGKTKFNQFIDYLFHLNEETLSLNERKSFIKKIDRKQLMKTCYPKEFITDNFVPKGFAGYKKTMKPMKLPKIIKLPKKANIYIAKGVKGQECILSYLKKQLKAMDSYNIKVLSTNEIIDLWGKNKADIIFWYLESEQVFEHINYFLPSSPIKIGFKKKIEIDIPSKNDPMYFEVMGRVTQVIVDRGIVLPMFKPENKLIHSNCIKINTSNVHSITYLKYNGLKLKNDCK